MLLSDKFICAGDKYSTISERVPAPIFKKIVLISSSIQKAEITVCGLGFYELYLNGENITKGRLSPYITNSNQVIYYDNYDITELLKEENDFEFLLGNGMQNALGGFIWDFEKTEFRSAPKLAFAIEIIYSNGKKEIIEADETVMVAESNILSDDIRLGEIYDANKNEREWKNATVTDTPNGEKVLSIAKPILPREDLKPVEIFKEDNAFIYDFGINTAGVCRLSVNAEKGQKIKLTFCEILKNGKFFVDTTTFDHSKNIYYQSDTYICKDGYNEWTPTFTYHGFRYVKVEGITEEQATKDLLTYVVFNTDLGKKGEFVCDNETINTLHKMTLNSTLSSFHHFPTDCPQREKNGWTADAALSSSHTLLYFEPTDNYKQWLISICKSQNEDGALPGIVPTWGWGFEWGNGPAWDSVLVELPYQIWQKRNDISAFEICKDIIIRYVKYLETRKNDKELLEIGLGDWCAPANPRKAPLILTDSIEAFDIANKAAKMFNVIGDIEPAEYCADFARRIRASIREHLFDKDTCIFAGGSQTSQAMGIYYGIINEDEKNKAFDYLLDVIRQDDYHIGCGVLGGRVLFHVLAENGEIDTALKILTNPTAPSYMQWVLEGDTALCEGFGEYDGLNSHNHHFWGNISAFFMEQICGIKVCADTINIEPHFPSEINSASANFGSIFGTVSVAWKRKNDKIVFNLEYPEKANGIFQYNGYVCPANQI
ncbi:MAG: family 78 glycoside hydrolase catalytic domain [Eubacterium sp.]|nr:family 78 glycoside hydrolase catalytic domain [Eubacterium sp.]